MSGVLGSVATDRGGASLAHQALLYGSEEEFVAGTVPFIRDGLDRGDPVRVVTTDRNAGWLRAALGADVGRVTFGETSQWYRHPVRALAAVHRSVQVASRGGQRLRMVGEPWWTARTAQQSMEWARYESLVNAALAWSYAALLCTYDASVVGPDVVTQVARTHPELVVNGAARPSPSYLDPAVFNAKCDRSPLPELPAPVLWFRFDGVGQLVILRDFVISHATQAGAAVLDVTQFVQAVYSVATNAIEHGGGSGVVRVWTGPQTILCEVSDTGAGLRAPLVGRLPSGRSTARGRGLWLARQWCDLVEVRSGPAGTTVRLHLTLPDGPDSAAGDKGASVPGRPGESG
ncbi:MAG TPA: anti-sigma factor RsbA family regulatory protein [Pseudonocardiaceae bacterium]|nr:anti-sigma factor RsbA family regulatory protein [Pseudonocardiaceae bacterium]